MKMLVTKAVLVASVALATLAAAEAAYAAPRHHGARAYHSRPAALYRGYSGRSQFNIDRADRASSPYAGGGF